MSVRLIKVPVSDEIVEVTVPSLKYPALQEATFGPGELIERVSPVGFSKFNFERVQTSSIALIVDESGRLKHLPVNPRASALYGMMRHGQPIVGDAYVIGEDWVDDGRDFVSLPEDITVETIIQLIAFEVAR